MSNKYINYSIKLPRLRIFNYLTMKIILLHLLFFLCFHIEKYYTHSLLQLLYSYILLLVFISII